MEYQICYEDTVHDLATLVNGLIKAGWRPLGGMSIVAPVMTDESFERPFYSYYQVMILDTEIRDSHRIELNLGDVIVAQIKENITAAETERIWKQVKERFPDNEVMVLTKDTQLKVIARNDKPTS